MLIIVVFSQIKSCTTLFFFLILYYIILNLFIYLFSPIVSSKTLGKKKLPKFAASFCGILGSK